MLRHPGYAGSELAFIGVGLMYGTRSEWRRPVASFRTARSTKERLAGEGPLDQGAVIVNRAGQELQMDDGAITCWHQVNHLAHRCGILIASYD